MIATKCITIKSCIKHNLTTLTKAKVWEWYGTAWTISDP